MRKGRRERGSAGEELSFEPTLLALEEVEINL